MRHLIVWISLIFALLLLCFSAAFSHERSMQEAPGYIAFVSTRTGEPQIHIMDSSGQIFRIIDYKLAYMETPTQWWSLDSFTLNFRTRQQDYKFEVVNSKLELIPETVSFFVTSPNWQWEIYVAHDNDVFSLNPGIYRRRYDEVEYEKILEINNTGNINSRWLGTNYKSFTVDQKHYIVSIDDKTVLIMDIVYLHTVVSDEDGDWLFYSTSDERLFRTRVEKFEPQLLFDSSFEYDFSPGWIINPDMLLIKYYDENIDVDTIAIYEFETGETHRLFDIEYDAHINVHPSPNQKRLLFEIEQLYSTQDGRQINFYTVNLETHATYFTHNQLVNHGAIGTVANPSWSGDSEWIAFQLLINGSSDIFRIRLDGTGLKNLTNNPNWDIQPHWSPLFDKPWHPNSMRNSSLAILVFVLGFVLWPSFSRRINP